jgi:predicted Rossmann fold flavoprotein
VHKHGIAYHEKELGQLFCDISSKQIVKMLVDECQAAGVQIRTDCSVQRIEHGSDGFRVHTTQGLFHCASLVVATGGLSIPSMGATGFGYEVARQFGHQVLPTRAGLVPLTLSGKHQERLADLSGVALPIEARCNGKSFQNFMLLTHRGVSGPAILQISSFWQPGDALELDLLPGQDAGEWLRQMKRAAAAELRTVLGEVLPKRLAQRLCEHWLPDRPCASWTSRCCARPRSCWARSRWWPAAPKATALPRSPWAAWIAEVSSSTMESKRVPGLHFVGEVLDVTGWLGGYNFQWAGPAATRPAAWCEPHRRSMRARGAHGRFAAHRVSRFADWGAVHAERERHHHPPADRR